MELLKSVFQQEERPSKNLFDRYNIEEESSDSFINFEYIKDDGKLHLFMFYAPWCGHCKRKETFLKKLVNNHNNKIKVHTYNCEKLREKDKFIENIKGYPTFKMGYKEKTYDTDLLEFIVFALAISIKNTIEHVVNKLQESALRDNLKRELEGRKGKLKEKFKKILKGKDKEAKK